MQAAVSVIRNSEVVRYSGAATVLNIILWRYRLVQCLLFGRGPLLGVSVNRESTVLGIMGTLLEHYHTRFIIRTF